MPFPYAKSPGIHTQSLTPPNNHNTSPSPSPAANAPLGGRPGKPARTPQTLGGAGSLFCNQKGTLITTLVQKKMHENCQSENSCASKDTSSIFLPSVKGPIFKPPLELVMNLNKTSKGSQEETAVPPDPRRRQGRYISPETGSTQSRRGTGDYSDSLSSSLSSPLPLPGSPMENPLEKKVGSKQCPPKALQH